MIRPVEAAGVPGVHRPPVREGRARRGARPATVARWRSPRPACSTCSCRSTTRQWLRGCEQYLFPAPSGRSRPLGGAPGRVFVKDDLQVASTDHRPFDFEGQKELGRGDFLEGPERVARRRGPGRPAARRRRGRRLITRERWVEVISTAPAKLFGMYPRKGSVSVGADADLVIYDPNRRRIDLGEDPPHGRRLLVLTRAAASR